MSYLLRTFDPDISIKLCRCVEITCIQIFCLCPFSCRLMNCFMFKELIVGMLNKESIGPIELSFLFYHQQIVWAFGKQRLCSDRNRVELHLGTTQLPGPSCWWRTRSAFLETQFQVQKSRSFLKDRLNNSTLRWSQIQLAKTWSTSKSSQILSVLIQTWTTRVLYTQEGSRWLYTIYTMILWLTKLLQTSCLVSDSISISQNQFQLMKNDGEQKFCSTLHSLQWSPCVIFFSVHRLSAFARSINTLLHAANCQLINAVTNSSSWWKAEPNAECCWRTSTQSNGAITMPKESKVRAWYVVEITSTSKPCSAEMSDEEIRDANQSQKVGVHNHLHRWS